MNVDKYMLLEKVQMEDWVLVKFKAQVYNTILKEKVMTVVECTFHLLIILCKLNQPLQHSKTFAMCLQDADMLQLFRKRAKCLLGVSITMTNSVLVNLKKTLMLQKDASCHNQ